MMTRPRNRNAFDDHNDKASRAIFSRGLPQEAETRVTIAIPTYRRRRLMLEALRSALAQDWSGPVEIIVVDNEPDDSVLTELRDLSVPHNMRVTYYANDDNLGMFGNWNRAITLAGSAWVTILNDDDLLAPDFLSAMDAGFGLDRSTEGLICQKTPFDVRLGQTPQGSAADRRLRHLVLDLLRFGFADRRRLTARHLFWDCATGNGLGFLFRREAAIALGGYQPEDYPSADYAFFVRFAQSFGLWQTRRRLGFVRVEDNATLRRETLEATVRQDDRLRRVMLSSGAPRSWDRWRRFITARQIDVMDRVSPTPLERGAIQHELGLTLPRRGKFLILAVRLLHGAL